LFYTTNYYCVHYDDGYTSTISGTNNGVVAAEMFLDLREDGSYSLIVSALPNFDEEGLFNFNFSDSYGVVGTISMACNIPMTCWSGFSNTYPDDDPGTQGVYQKLGDGSILIEGEDVIYGEDYFGGELIDYYSREWSILVEPR
jgi:hypothetical protein